MNKEQVLQDMANKGYLLSSHNNHNNNWTILCFSKYISFADIWISLRISIDGDNIMRFDYPHLKMCYNLTSGDFSYMIDDEFDRRERIFFLYCKACKDIEDSIFVREKWDSTKQINGQQIKSGI